MNVAAVTNLSMSVTGAIVTNEAEGSRTASYQLQSTGKICVIVEVLTKVDKVGSTVRGFCSVVSLLVSARFFLLPSAGIPHSLFNRSMMIQLVMRQQQLSHRTWASLCTVLAIRTRGRWSPSILTADSGRHVIQAAPFRASLQRSARLSRCRSNGCMCPCERPPTAACLVLRALSTESVYKSVEAALIGTPKSSRYNHFRQFGPETQNRAFY